MNQLGLLAMVLQCGLVINALPANGDNLLTLPPTEHCSCFSDHYPLSQCTGLVPDNQYTCAYFPNALGMSLNDVKFVFGPTTTHNLYTSPRCSQMARQLFCFLYLPFCMRDYTSNTGEATYLKVCRSTCESLRSDQECSRELEREGASWPPQLNCSNTTLFFPDTEDNAKCVKVGSEVDRSSSQRFLASSLRCTCPAPENPTTPTVSTTPSSDPVPENPTTPTVPTTQSPAPVRSCVDGCQSMGHYEDICGLDYSCTQFPNVRGQRNISDVRIEMPDELFRRAVNSNCSESINRFLCLTYVPPCNADYILRPCRSWCERLQSECSQEFEESEEFRWETTYCDAFPVPGNGDFDSMGVCIRKKEKQISEPTLVEVPTTDASTPTTVIATTSPTTPTTATTPTAPITTPECPTHASTESPERTQCMTRPARCASRSSATPRIFNNLRNEYTYAIRAEVQGVQLSDDNCHYLYTILVHELILLGYCCNHSRIVQHPVTVTLQPFTLKSSCQLVESRDSHGLTVGQQYFIAGVYNEDVCVPDLERFDINEPTKKSLIVTSWSHDIQPGAICSTRETLCRT